MKAGSALEGARSVLVWISRMAARLAIAAGLAGVACWALLWRELPAAEGRTALLVLAAILLLASPATLTLLVVALRGLMTLPERLRDAPAGVTSRAGEIRLRATELGQARRRGPIHALRALIRLSWAVASSREVVQLAPAIVLRPWLVAASAAAAAGALLEILIGAAALIWLLAG